MATFLIVGVLSIFSMSHFAFASSTVLYDSGVNQSTYNTGDAGSLGVCDSTNCMQSGHFGTITAVQVYSLRNTGSATSSAYINFTSIDSGLGGQCRSDPQDNTNWNGGMVTFIFSTPCVVDGYTNGTEPNLAFQDSGAGENLTVGTNPTDGSGYYASALIIYTGGSPLDTSTHFVSLIPATGTTTATSTTVGSHVYVSSSDFATGTVLHMTFSNQTISLAGGSALDAWNSSGLGVGIDLPLVSGDNTVSTTTVFDTIGDTFGYYSIRKPNSTFLIGSFLPDDILVSSSTEWTVVARTGLDQAMASGTDALVSALLTGTTTQPVLACNFSGFDLQNCLISILIPSQSVLQYDLTRFENETPFGYVFRTIDILTSTPATSSLPSISYTFASTSALAVVGTVHFDPFATLLDSASIVNTPSDQAGGLNVWQIFNPIIYIIVYFSLFVLIIRDLTKIEFSGDGSVDLSNDIVHAEKMDNRHIGRRIFKRRVRNNKLR